MNAALCRALVPVATLALLAGTAAHAAPPQAFLPGSMAAIRAAHEGHAHIVALWSLACAPCRHELTRLADFARRHPGVPLVLIATDGIGERAAIAARLRAHGLGQAESWVFADDFVERLRHEIDPRWHGELPRTYLRGADGSVQAVTGRLDAARIEDWLRAPRGR